MNKKIIFVHGYTSSSRADWYPNISVELNKFGVDYSIPDLPGGKYPYSSDWVKIIEKEVENSSKPAILVRHSSGTRAVLLYLDKYHKKVDTVILIAPLSNEIKNANRHNGDTYPDFFDYKIDMKKIKKLARKFIIIHSRDDSELDYKEHGVALSKELGAKLITFKDRNHFYEPGDAPYILEILRKELNF